MVALIQSKNHAGNKGKMAGKYQFDTHPTGIGLKEQTVFLERINFYILLHFISVYYSLQHNFVPPRMSHVKMRVPPTLYGPTEVSTSEPFSSSKTEMVGGTEINELYLTFYHYEWLDF